MIATKAKFCHECGTTLQMMYPGNNPENGPAELRCVDHETIGERIIDNRFEIATQVLEEIAGPDQSPHPEDQVPDYIKAVARITLMHFKS